MKKFFIYIIFFVFQSPVAMNAGITVDRVSKLIIEALEEDTIVVDAIGSSKLPVEIMLLTVTTKKGDEAKMADSLIEEVTLLAEDDEVTILTEMKDKSGFPFYIVFVSDSHVLSVTGSLALTIDNVYVSTFHIQRTRVEGEVIGPSK